MARLRFKYEIALDPKLVVDNANDGRLVEVSPIASSPFGERGVDRRVIELNDNADLRHELMNTPGNVPTKLTAYLWDYQPEFDFDLPDYTTGSSREFGALCPSQTIFLNHLPAGAAIALEDTSIRSTDFVLSYRTTGTSTFTRITKTALPFTLPDDTEVLRYRFRVPPAAGQWRYYGIEIADIIKYFGVGTNGDVVAAQRYTMPVDGTQRIDPFGTNTGHLAFLYDYEDDNDKGSLSFVREGNEYVVVALDEGVFNVYLNAHPTDYSQVPGPVYMNQTFNIARNNGGYIFPGNTGALEIPTTGALEITVNGVRIGSVAAATLRGLNTWGGYRGRAFPPYRSIAIVHGGVTYYIGRPRARTLAFGTDQNAAANYAVEIRGQSVAAQGTRIKTEWTITPKITNDQLISGDQYNLPRIPLESGAVVTIDLGAYLGNATHPARAVVSDATYLTASISSTGYILTITGRGSPTASGEDEKVTISQADDDGNTLTFDIPIKVTPAVVGTKVGSGTNLYPMSALSELLKLPKGITSYQIDLSKYDWEDAYGIDSLDASTFTLLPSTHPNLATATLTNDVIVTINTHTGSTVDGAVSFQIDTDDGETESINLLIPNIRGETPPVPDAPFAPYEYVDDPAIPPAALASPTGPRQEGNTLILYEQHGYLGQVDIDEQDRIVITEIPFLDTEIEQKTLGSLFVDEGALFALPGQLANNQTIVNWPSQWVEE